MVIGKRQDFLYLYAQGWHTSMKTVAVIPKGVGSFPSHFFA